jgi:hypothetical protein
MFEAASAISLTAAEFMESASAACPIARPCARITPAASL